MIETRSNHRDRNGAGLPDKVEQRRRILAMVDHHISQCQVNKEVGSLTIELEFVRGGNIKGPYIEYQASWRFLDKVEGLT